MPRPGSRAATTRLLPQSKLPREGDGSGADAPKGSDSFATDNDGGDRAQQAADERRARGKRATDPNTKDELWCTQAATPGVGRRLKARVSPNVEQGLEDVAGGSGRQASGRVDPAVVVLRSVTERAADRARSRSRSPVPFWGIPVGTEPHTFANEPEVWRPPRRAAAGYDESLAEARRAGAARARMEACITLDANGDERDASGKLLPRVRQPDDTRAVSVSSTVSDAGPGWETDASAPDDDGVAAISAGQRNFGNDLEVVAAAAIPGSGHTLECGRRNAAGGRRLAEMPTLDAIIAREAASVAARNATGRCGQRTGLLAGNSQPGGHAPQTRTTEAGGGTRRSLAEMPMLDELIAREAEGSATHMAAGDGGPPDANADQAQPGRRRSMSGSPEPGGHPSTRRVIPCAGQ